MPAEIPSLLTVGQIAKPTWRRHPSRRLRDSFPPDTALWACRNLPSVRLVSGPLDRLRIAPNRGGPGRVASDDT